MQRPVFLAEDDGRTALVRLLHSYALTVRAFESSGGLLVALEHATPDLIVVDLWTSRATGANTVARLHQAAGGVHAAAEETKEAAQVGVAALVVKPIDLRNVTPGVDRVLHTSAVRHGAVARAQGAGEP